MLLTVLICTVIGALAGSPITGLAAGVLITGFALFWPEP